MDILCRFLSQKWKKSVFIFLIHFSNLAKITSLDHSVMGTLGSTLSSHEYSCTSITCAYFPLE